MTFDPFGDFATRGYLRNLAGERDPDIVRRLEHTSFMTGIQEAFDRLGTVERLGYQNVLETHLALFEAVYPWAGQDRLQTAPDLAVSKGPVLFAYPKDIRRAVDFALDIGQDKTLMRRKPGEVMGYLAYGHPFLDGNGRAIMVLHAVLAQRAGFSIDWAATDKAEYLSALTHELDSPGEGYLDAYLKPFVRGYLTGERLIDQVSHAPGLDGSTGQNEVLGKTDDPALQARYAQQELKRRQLR